MSRQADEAKQQKSSNPRKKGQKPAMGLRSFNPTKEEKEAIRAIDLPLGDILDTLGTFGEDGIAYAQKYNSTNSSFFLIARAETEDWKTAPAISVWHSDFQTLFFMMYYALTVKYPHFPEGWGELTAQDFDW